MSDFRGRGRGGGGPRGRGGDRGGFQSRGGGGGDRGGYQDRGDRGGYQGRGGGGDRGGFQDRGDRGGYQGRGGGGDRGGFQDRGDRGGYQGRGGGGDRGGYQDRGDRGGYQGRGGGGDRGGYQDRGDRGGYQGRGGGGDRGSFRGARGGGGGGFGGNTGGFNNDCPMPASEIHKIVVPQQMARGREGTPIQLIGNFYKIITEPIVVFHYDLDIIKSVKEKPTKEKSIAPKMAKLTLDEPEVKATTSAAADAAEGEVPVEEEEVTEGFTRFLTKFSPAIVEALVKANQTVFKDVPYVFDGQKNLYTSKSLPIKGTQEFTIKVDIEGGRPGYFHIKIKRVDRVDLSEVVEFYKGTTNCISERAVSIFEMAFRFICGQAYTSYQRKFFDLDDLQTSPKVRLADFVSGFINSVRLTEFGLALNVHLKTTAIISRSFVELHDLVRELARVRNLETEAIHPMQLREVNKILKHVKIFTNHTKSKIAYTIDRIVPETPQKVTFPGKDGTVTSIAEYFKKSYGITLRHFPLVQTSGKKRFLPLELCFLVDKQFLSNSKADANIQRELLFKSTHAPNVYFEKLNKIVGKVSQLNPALQSAFGLKAICPKPVQLTGRVLPAPRYVEGRSGSFYRPGKVPQPTKWGFFCFDVNVNPRELSAFIEQMAGQAGRLGLDFGKIPFPISPVDIKSIRDIKATFANLQKNSNCELIFVGIPTRHRFVEPSTMYKLIKHYCDQTYGIISCCFKADYITRPPKGYFENFLLKVNGKIGGLNMILEPAMVQEQFPFRLDKTIVIGVDVNHPGATEKVLSSISAAVGSTDAAFTRYSAAIRVQSKATDEMVKQLDSMVEELLVEYRKENKGQLPDNMIIFRDGVSEGQFEKVLKIEIPLIQAVFKKIGKQMKLTVVVVQKRHHTRFVLAKVDTSGRSMRKPTYNVPGGTVVDQSIVEPIYSVFYLNSHFSPLGTSKPTKYIILRDDLKLSTDHMQKFCYFACHNCIRTKKVISIPTAIRYADLCAYRSKLHIEGQRELITINPTQAELEEERIISKLNDWVKIHEKVRNRLYYC